MDNLVHATAIAIDGHGVLLVGPSGCGKSDLALRLIDRGAMLVSDDAVPVNTNGDCPTISAAPNIEGRLEVRNVGIIKLSYVQTAPLRLVVDLMNNNEDRLPDGALATIVAGYSIPLARLCPFEISAAIKVEFALREIVDAGQWPVAAMDIDRPEGKPN